MTKRDLLLEIGLEEMPARFVTASMQQLAEKVEKWLKEKAVGYSEVKPYSTPRRLAILVTDVAEAQEDIHEEAKGPSRKIALDAEGNWSKAAIGFTKGQGVSVDDIFFKEINGVEYVHVNKFIEGRTTAELLPELKDLVTGMTFPKNMRWADQDLRYIRPIKWLLALFGEEIIRFNITGVESERTTRGHRFLGEEIEIGSPKEYQEALRGQYVIVDSTERKNTIIEQIKALEKEQGWSIPIDEDLLEEVNNLVEYPTVLFGRFEDEFLELPPEVLITSMKEHQRYFPVKNMEGKLLSKFVTVRNGNAENLDKVSKGNEKVLRARLSDADFFYKEDQKTEIATSLKKLENVVYHEEIGTLAQKTKRVQKITEQLTNLLHVSEEEKKWTERAAEIGKFDLVSHMVYEFPELQGYMGEKYALIKGEEKEVAAAINEHYKPRFAEDSVPPSIAGSILSVAEKIDTIAACFAIGIIPTGSQDPYALRRQASGIVHILEEKKWAVTVEELVQLSLAAVEAEGIVKGDVQQVEADLITFFKARVKHLLNESNISHDIVDALLENGIGNVAILVERASLLERKKQAPEFKEILEALSRVMNIAKKGTHKTVVDESLFENEQETKLYDKLKKITAVYKTAESEEEHFDLLASLRPEIEQYFEHTMVMAEDEKLKNNRLSLMMDLNELIGSFAAVNKLMIS